MLVQPLLGCIAQAPCNNAAQISSITKDGEVLNTCAGGGWAIDLDINLNQELSAQHELYVEKATNSTGDNWAFYGRYGSTGETTVLVEHDDPTVGSDGEYSPTTLYWRIRAWVVPIGAGTGSACSGPSTYGTIEDVTANTCFE